MSDELAFDYERFRFIELRGDGSKLPAKSWGGYDQDFETAEHVYTHDEVEMFPMENWGIVDVADPPHGSFALLIFDLDVHKAPDDFDIDRISVPSNTLVVKSQNGGLHVYIIVSGCRRGDLNESDFEVAADIPFDIDIRGSAVSHHVVAPSDIPGVGGDYRVASGGNNSITTVYEPADALAGFSIDGEPLLRFNPDSPGVDYQFDVPTEPPEEMPTCYHSGLELRKAAPDDHPNTHKVNMLTAACGLAAGYDPETVAAHFCGEWAPRDGDVDLSDKETTEYQVNQIDRGGYKPPSEQTLRDYGILGDGQHCDDDCPIAYHGPFEREQPTLDIVDAVDSERDSAAEAAAVAGDADPPGAETDGGAVANSATSTTPRMLDARVRAIIREFNDDHMQAKTARHRIAQELCHEFHFVYPEAEVRGWRETLYVFDDEDGIYEPRGEAHIESVLERVAGDFCTNRVTNEIVSKVSRMTSERGEMFETDPHRLVVGNGILDLHTGELDAYTATEYHRTKIDVDWNPDAGEPDAIDEFLHDIVKPSDVPTLYRLIAHTLYKEYIAEKAAMLIGGGQNGKSVFLDFIEEFLGEWNVSHRALQDFEKQFTANQLEGKLANIHPDMGDRGVKDMSTFKKLTGRDRFTADVKYESPITFRNYATLVFAANEMPVFGEDNHAVWRRWVYVDFPHTFDARDPDAKDPEPKADIMRRLTADRQLEALLVRCQKEIQRWHETDEQFFADAMPPEEVRDKMKKAAEPIYAFASTCLEAGESDEDYVPKSVVRAAYRAYADAEDLPRIPDNQFGDRLLDLRDYAIESTQRRVDGKRMHVYAGIRLSSRGRQLVGLDEADGGQATVGDGKYGQSKPVVMDRLREMVEQNDNEPVPKAGVVWGCTSDIHKRNAEDALDLLIQDGRVIEVGDGVMPKD